MPPNAENPLNKYDFFISRAGEDAEWGLWTAEILQEAGRTYFLQEESIPTGSNIQHRIANGIEASKRVIAILSERYLAKEGTMAELTAAFHRDQLGKNTTLIIVQVSPCKIPDYFRTLSYLSLTTRDQTSREKLEAAIGINRSSRDHRTSIASLPTVDPTLIGRDPQLIILNQAWTNPATNFLQIIAPGGTGKTAVMTKWYTQLLNQTTIFGWSFYSQGVREDSQTSSDPFFAKVLPFFGITMAPSESIYDKAEALARRLQQERALLILDGIEPLQESSGDVRDPGIKTLLKELAANNKGLVLCTTRNRITDVPDDKPRALSIDLDNLDPEHGAEYLRHLGIQGTDDELREASEAYGNHALALTLLGTYLSEFCQHDIRRRVEIPALIDPDLKAGQHARHVMEAYARMYAGKTELEILRALGYFDRPAEPEALKLVMLKTDPRRYQLALNNLRKARLILSSDPTQSIDCHPLVREHFAWVMRSTATEAFREGHSRLYDYYCKEAPEQPDTLAEMTPLFYAVYHGFRATRHQECLDDVYFGRLRGDEAYLTHKLGAWGTDLSLLANFFESPWTKPAPTLSPADQAWVTNSAGFSLRALGRLNDAVEPQRIAAEARVTRQDWKNAAQAYTNLSELHLTLGNVSEAVTNARKSVELADWSEDDFQRRARRSGLGNAMHQSGNLTESARLFQEAESIQPERRLQSPILDSVFGYQYCDLLLSQGQTAEVLRRTTRTLPTAMRSRRPLDIGLDHLALGRAHPAGSPESTTHLNQAVNYLRQSGQLDDLPLALLPRGTPQDLAEVFQVATRSGMRLHLTDYHLAMARNLLTTDPAAAVQHFQEAEALVNQTGYHRRDPDLAQLRRDLKIESQP